MEMPGHSKVERLIFCAFPEGWPSFLAPKTTLVTTACIRLLAGLGMMRFSAA